MSISKEFEYKQYTLPKLHKASVYKIRAASGLG